MSMMKIATVNFETSMDKQANRAKIGRLHRASGRAGMQSGRVSRGGAYGHRRGRVRGGERAGQAGHLLEFRTRARGRVDPDVHRAGQEARHVHLLGHGRARPRARLRVPQRVRACGAGGLRGQVPQDPPRADGGLLPLPRHRVPGVRHRAGQGRAVRLLRHVLPRGDAHPGQQGRRAAYLGHGMAERHWHRRRERPHRSICCSRRRAPRRIWCPSSSPRCAGSTSRDTA